MAGSGGGSSHELADRRLESFDGGRELRVQKLGSEFDRKKLMPDSSGARSADPLAPSGVEGNLIGSDRAIARARAEGSGARKVEADLQAFAMEAAAPVEVLIEPEIVPLHAEGTLEKAA